MQGISEESLQPLRTELNQLIDDGNCQTSFKETIHEALRQPGHAFASPAGQKWPLFVLLSCQSAAAGEWRHALPAAASFELLSAALEIIDDLQDGDRGPIQHRYGDAQALNVAYALLMMSQCAIWRLPRFGVSSEKCAAVAEAISFAALTAGKGQHLDLLYESRPQVTQDECLQVVSQKSAGLVSAAFRVGAILGTVDKPWIEKYAELGWHLGMQAQLANDIEALLPGRNGKSDIERGKKTLPLVYKQNDNRNGNGPTKNGYLADADLRAALWKSGALHYTWVIAELHRQKARDIVKQLNQVRPAEQIFGPLTNGRNGNH